MIMTSPVQDARPPQREARLPSQERSRKRFEQILDAAGTLISARGLAPVSMTDIAEEAGMALTGVYRYFPNKQAVVRELALRTFEVDLDMATVFDASGDDLELNERIKANMVTYCNAHLQNTLRSQIRAAIHADAELSALDLEDSQKHAAIIAAGLDRAGVETRRSVIERRALVLVSVVDGVIRLANRLDPDEAAAVIEEFAEASQQILLRPNDGTAQ